MSTPTDFRALRDHLNSKAAQLRADVPAMKGFGQLHGAAMKGGALSLATKELIALGIAVAGRCQGCIAFHTYSALKAGAKREEILDTLGVAMLMGGGPAMVYALEAHSALEQFEGEFKD